ncbi:hypothetical protein [Aeromonas hydrophila]|uniref:hypothetical protein n=1 Tax=Aeromonas hydrophila TaxID=644 RepID=UPI003673047B
MIIKNSQETNIKLWVELLIFLCSYYPLFLILFIRDINKDTIGIPIGVVEWEHKVSFLAITMITISSCTTLLTGYIIRSLLTSTEGACVIKLTEVNAVRGDMINYTLPFLIGLFAFDYKTWQSIISLIVFLSFMFAFSRNERIILLNPMFLLLGVRLYNIKYKKIGQPNAEFSSSALCMGSARQSEKKVRFLENSGITFISALVDR